MLAGASHVAFVKVGGVTAAGTAAGGGTEQTSVSLGSTTRSHFEVASPNV